MLSSRPSPPKPWEINRQSTGLTTSTTPTTMATTTTPATTATASPTSPTSASIPRPLSSNTSPSTLSRPWDLRSGGTSSLSPSTYGSSYGSGYGSTGYGSSGYGGYGSSYGSSYGSGYGSSYGGYGSGYGSSYGSGYGGYGSSYGSSYGGYGSGYGGYGSSLGGYGSSYGGYGSRYGGYGSSYGGGYGSYGGGYGGAYGNRYGQPGGQLGQPGMFQSVLEGGYNQMRNFGGVVEGVSRFSRLLDMNFDAMHGSVGSVLRLLEVAGEFLFAVKSFSFFKNMFGGIGKIGRFISFLLFGPGQKLVVDSSKNHGNIEFNDYLKYQQTEKRRRVLPVILVLLGLCFFGVPMFLAKYIKSFREHEKLSMEANPGKGLENAWKQENVVVQALQDFMGQNHMELSFKKDESIIVLAKPYPDWWEGEINGRVGLFPANLTRPLPTSDAPVIEPVVEEKM